MTPKLYKAADVCEIAQLQPYVLRSWEKEFPGIGVQRSADGPRLYRDTDLEQVQRIKQLVFGEGLTLAGARRRLDDSHPSPVASVVAAPPEPPARVAPPAKAAPAKSAARSAPVDDAARARIAQVRAGLQSILDLLSGAASMADIAGAAEEYQLRAPTTTSAAPAPAPARVRKLATRRAPTKKAPVAKRSTVAKRSAVTKRKRASA